MWATEPDYSSYDWSSSDVTTVVGTHGDVTIGGALGSSGNVSSHYYLPISANLKNSDNPWTGYLSISSTKQIETIEILYCPNGSNQTSIAWVAWGSDVTPNQKTLAHGVTTGTKSSKAWDNAVWETIDLSETEAYTVYLSRSIREFKDKDEQSLSNFGAGQTINVLGIKVWLKSAPTTKTIYLNPVWSTNDWCADNAAIFVHAWKGAETADVKMTAANSCDNVLKADIPVDATDLLFVRCAAGSENVVWEGTNHWNQTGNLTISNTVDLYNITDWGAAQVAANNFAATSFSISFNDNGADAGTAMSAINSIACGSDQVLPAMTRTKDGFVFTGWKDANDNVYVDGATISNITENIVLTAQWSKPLGLLVKVVAGGGANYTFDTNVIGATCAASLSSSKKVDSGKYFGIEGNFKAGDIVNINCVSAATGGKLMIFNSKTTASNETLIYSENGAGVTGDNIFVLTSDQSAIYVYRDNTFCTWNPLINYISVTRHGDVLSESLNGVKIDGVSATENTDYTIEGNVITLSNSYLNAPEIALVNRTSYEDGSNADEDVEVTLTVNGENTYFEGNATIGSTSYSVSAPVTPSVVVTYYNGATVLGSENVIVGGNPAEYAQYQTKAHCAFEGWYTEVELTSKVADVAALVINEATNLYGKWTTVFSQSFDIEAYVEANGTSDNANAAFQVELAAKGYEFFNIDAIDGYNDAKDYRNYPYVGLKLKKSGAYVSALIPAGKYVVLHVGHIVSAEVQFNDVTTSITGIDADHDKVYVFNPAQSNRSFKFVCKQDGQTCVLKGIEIVDYARGGFTVGEFGTICLPYATSATNGATFYNIAGVRTNGETISSVALEEETGNLEVGKPYIFTADAEYLTADYTGEKVTEAAAATGLVGNLSATPLDVPQGSYIIGVDDKLHKLAGANATVGQNRAYIDLTGVAEASLAPGRIMMVVAGTDTATNLDAVEAEDTVKFVENGQFFIKKNGVIYNVMGQIIK